MNDDDIERGRGRPVILCSMDHFLPGYRSGGPVRTIANFIDHFGDEFDIRIVCRDRDLGSETRYAEIEPDSWNAVGQARVYYVSPTLAGLAGLLRVYRETPHDILYLNSFFSPVYTILPLVARALTPPPRRPCVLAPRGELSLGALGIKAWKKRFFMRTAVSSGLYHGVRWQASSDLERDDIRRELGDVAEDIVVAPDLTPRAAGLSRDPSVIGARAAGPLRVIFLSRISRMKNLDFLLAVLSKIDDPIDVSIYGPEEDMAYWKLCDRMIKALPPNIRVDVRGPVPQHAVGGAFARHDLFVFPTRGENFGHVVLESLTAGTPVLMSDLTPWRQDERGGLRTEPLDEGRWVAAIREWSKYGDDTFMTKRMAALRYAEAFVADEQTSERNRSLFAACLGRPSRGPEPR